MEKDYIARAAHEQKIQTQKFEHFYHRYNNHLESLDVSYHQLCIDFSFLIIYFLPCLSQIEVKLLQRSNVKTRELEKLGKALDKNGEP